MTAGELQCPVVDGALTGLLRLDQAALDDVDSAYRALRQAGPVVWVEELQAYAVTGYEELSQVLGDPVRFSSALADPKGPRVRERITAIRGALADRSPEFRSLLGRLDPDWRAIKVLTTADPPLHTRQRKLINRAFTPRRVQAMAPRIREVARELVRGFGGRTRVDLVADYAAPLPLMVIAEQMGVGTDRLADFKRWADDFVVSMGNDNLTEDMISGQTRTHVELGEFFAEVLADRQRSPRDDVISVIANDDPEITHVERLAIACQLLAAGIETTAHLISEAAAVLAAPGDLAGTLRDDPARIPTYVEEVLRLASPSQWLYRFVTEDTELSGVRLPAGSAILAMFAAANRDAGQFVEPASVALSRPNSHSHLAFGKGPHFCVGAGLARVEGAAAVEALLERYRGWTVVNSGRKPSYLLHGYSELVVDLEAVQG